MEYPSLPNIQDEPQPSTSQVQSSIILPGPRKNNLTKERARLVTKMKEMISLVYNCSNVDDLRKGGDRSTWNTFSEDTYNSEDAHHSQEEYESLEDVEYDQFSGEIARDCNIMNRGLDASWKLMMINN